MTVDEKGHPQELMAAIARVVREWAHGPMLSETALSEIRAILAYESAKTAEGPVDYQARVVAATRPIFHDDPTDVTERRNRFAEEANETCQSLGMTADEAHALVDYTYGRPVGDPAKEIGSTMLTLALLAHEAGHSLSACAEADLANMSRPETIAKIRAKRATRHGRGPLPGFAAPPPPQVTHE